LPPHKYNEPSVVKHPEFASLAIRADMIFPLREVVAIRVGRCLSWVSPVPKLPALLDPHPYNLLLFVMASVQELPPIAFTNISPFRVLVLTRTGVA
jgi:hypothetical protein